MTLNYKLLDDAAETVHQVQEWGREHWGFTPRFQDPKRDRRAAGFWRLLLGRLREGGKDIGDYLAWLTENYHVLPQSKMVRFFGPCSEVVERFLQESSRVWKPEDEPVRRLVEAYWARFPEERRSPRFADRVEPVVRERLGQGMREDELTACLREWRGGDTAPWKVFPRKASPLEHLKPIDRARVEAQSERLRAKIEQPARLMREKGALGYLRMRNVWEPRGTFAFEEVFEAAYGRPFDFEKDLGDLFLSDPANRRWAEGRLSARPSNPLIGRVQSGEMRTPLLFQERWASLYGSKEA